jgi:coenzyme F420-0:L-glutamate ligase/coenzyme F420-1:gamma-L-glutamate ligase
LQQSSAIVRAAPNVLIARHKLGFVLANAGVDRSNLGVEQDSVLLLPEDPDASARMLGERLGVACIVSDSFGRPWRMGVVNVAIGAWGLPALVDRRGARDRDGRALEVTQVALADLIASAAGLAMGEGAEGVPAALVRGCSFDPGNVPAAALVRPLGEDLFQ